MVGTNLVGLSISLLISFILSVVVGPCCRFRSRILTSVPRSLNTCMAWAILLFFGSRFSEILGRLTLSFPMLSVTWRR